MIDPAPGRAEVPTVDSTPDSTPSPTPDPTPGSSPTPARLAVFLRGINLGRRRVKNDELAAAFLKAEFTGVETYQASGNVVIDGSGEAAPGDLAALEARTEEAVHRELGFEADAFVRTLDALAALVEHDKLVRGEAEGLTPHVIFLKAAPEPAAVDALQELWGPDDQFPILGCEVVWLRRGRLTDSEIQTRHLEKALGGVPSTMRKVTTLRRMVRRFGTGS